MPPKSNIPPKGPPRNTPLSAGDMVHAMKSGLYHEWIPARIIEIFSKNNEVCFKLKTKIQVVTDFILSYRTK